MREKTKNLLPPPRELCNKRKILMRQIRLFVVFTVSLLLISLIAIPSYSSVSDQEKQEQFYVGVTYCGSSVQEAKELIDKVKGYTNLFVLLSGTLNAAVDVQEIGDYAITSKLNFAVCQNSRYFWSYITSNKEFITINEWAIIAKERWGEQFIGIYYRDEPGGDMLDKWVDLEIISYQTERGDTTIHIGTAGSKIIMRNNTHVDNQMFQTAYTYHQNGQVDLDIVEPDLQAKITYYPDGRIIISEPKIGEYNNLYYDVYTSENITMYAAQIPAYKEILKKNPIQNYDDAANAFVNMNKELLDRINKTQLYEKEIMVFTADYGLYWWDYKGGYDMILAELAWNNSATQQIGLVRGAANLQNKQWGTILTWKYTHPPYLTDGEEMFEQMKTSYEAGAQYVMIFNYSEDPKNPNTLLEEHFVALERFWCEVVENSEVQHGGIEAEAVFVLPKNYGWGMRALNDNIWGLWHADNNAQEIWNQLQSKIDQHGLKLDIVFEDKDYPVVGKYAEIYYGYQRVPTLIIVFAVLLIVAIIALFVIFCKIRKKKHKTTEMSSIKV